MTKIKKILKALIVSCLFFVASSFVSGQVIAAPRLFLDPTSKTVVIGNDVQLDLKIDVGTDQAFGADAVLFLPGTDVTVKSVSKGDFFTDFSFAQSGSSLEIHGYFATQFQTKTGSGTFATIILTAARAAGTGTVGFSCSGNGADTDIINGAGNNILSCANLNDSVITFSTGATASPSPAPGTGGNNNTGGNGPTNACGGTCGSVYNCNVNLFCYQGYCRNPDCPSSSTCGCNTATPTVKPRSTAKPTVKPTAKATPVIVAIAKTTPFPTFQPVATVLPVGTTPGPLANIKPVYIYAILGALALIIIIITVNALRKKSPPKFTPPTNIPPTFPVNPPPPTTY